MKVSITSKTENVPIEMSYRIANLTWCNAISSEMIYCLEVKTMIVLLDFQLINKERLHWR